ncbi:MAG: cytochrome ubiquinol oxidase subunit I [Armatimonadetes bacterium]|nr:cytochrome ubiquinol oxidase subunit I [Armatimonadota bacterium]
MDAVTWSRFQFGLLSTFHYLFPALTMGLAFLIFLLKLRAYRTGDEASASAARFWAKIFGVNFAVGVVTGIPLEFQFGTNWAHFSNFAGGVIGLTLAMEGMFAFFAESVFLGLFLYGEKKLSPKAHLLASFMVFVGSWLSGYFIIATNAFMQNPVGYSMLPDGKLQLSDPAAFVFNPWALVQYPHNMVSSVITACFVVMAVSALYLIQGKHVEMARQSMRTAIIVGVVSCVLIIFPTGDQQSKIVAAKQPAALAAMEGQFSSQGNADIVLIGQPDVKAKKLDNPLRVPGVLSYLIYGHQQAVVKGMDEFPPDQLPDNIEFLYFCYHVMAGLGTVMLLLMGISTVALQRKKLEGSKPLLWILMFAFPFPYIATTMGWLTAELGRQPWTVYGLLRTVHSASPSVSGGNVVFTMLGFLGMYLMIGLLFLYLVYKIVSKGPDPLPAATEAAA